MKIIFDWDGTIAKPDIAREASIRRLKTLGHKIDNEQMKNAQKNNSHYKLNKQLISKYTGINDDKGLTIMMTDLFKLHYLAVLNEMKSTALYSGMFDVVKKLNEQGHQICVVSVNRTDLIKHSLENLGMDKLIFKVYANTPDLKYSKKDVVEMAKKNLNGADYVIGDKEEDILAGKAVKAKTIYVTWGATDSDYRHLSDYSADKPEEILKIIK
ncbi:MAG: HAD family hydrolase [Candidatus Woesearchaeota archaeon]